MTILHIACLVTALHSKRQAPVALTQFLYSESKYGNRVLYTLPGYDYM